MADKSEKEGWRNVHFAVSVTAADGTTRLLSYHEFHLLFDPRAPLFDRSTVKQTLPARVTDLPLAVSEALIRAAVLLCTNQDGAGLD